MLRIFDGMAQLIFGFGFRSDRITSIALRCLSIKSRVGSPHSADD